jgi:hypothetical protein
MTLPSIKSLKKYKLQRDATSLKLLPTDTVVAFVRQSCPDSIKLWKALDRVYSSKEMSWRSVCFVDADNGGFLLSHVNFKPKVPAVKYPGFSDDGYEKLGEGTTVLPKIYIKGLGGNVEGCYFINHGDGINKIQ